MMHDHRFTIGTLRHEMINQSLQAGSQIDAKLVHSKQAREVLDGTGYIGLNGRGQALVGKAVGAPDVSDERAALFHYVACCRDGNSPIINQVRGVRSGERRSEENERK